MAKRLTPNQRRVLENIHLGFGWVAKDWKTIIALKERDLIRRDSHGKLGHGPYYLTSLGQVWLGVRIKEA